ncbi:MAG: glycosyltransferase family 4 protein [Phycisphaerales bacterium]
MSVIGFATYEIHPTTWGGCGVLLHHAAARLLRAGHSIIFLLDVPKEYFDRFDQKDRLDLPHPDRIRSYHVDSLCDDFPYTPDQTPGTAVWKSLRFAHAARKVIAREPDLDFLEFFEYCGVAYHTLIDRLFDEEPEHRPVIGSRLHNSIELIDHFGSTNALDLDRYMLYRLEHAALRLSESILAPTRTYFDAYYRDRYGLDPRRITISQSPKLEFPRVTRRPDPTGPFTIVYTGRVIQFKGVDQLVRAGVALLRKRPELEVTFEFIGPDSHESPLGDSFVAYLQTLIPKKWRSRFAFVGHKSHDEIAERLNEALFAVFPNRFESFCYAAHEVYDAGVPLIVNRLPGFADFFEHERNVLAYDGTTRGLLAEMERMIDDGALRDRLARPYAVATDPLGPYYRNPTATVAVAEGVDPATREGRTLILIRCPMGIDADGARMTREAVSSQTDERFDAVYLAPATDETAAFWWLGRGWSAIDLDGDALPPEALSTGVAICTLDAGDRPDPNWHAVCRRGLDRRSNAGFAATWGRRNTRPHASTIDIAPETYPFDFGAQLTRALIRTEPGRSVADLLDGDMGPLGEIALLWNAVENWGHGVVATRPLIECESVQPVPVDSALLQSLLTRYGHIFSDEAPFYCGLLVEETRRLERSLAEKRAAGKPASAAELWPDVSVDYKLRLAHELGGRDLAKIAFRKAAHRALWKCGLVRDTPGADNGGRGHQ